MDNDVWKAARREIARFAASNPAVLITPSYKAWERAMLAAPSLSVVRRLATQAQGAVAPRRRWPKQPKLCANQCVNRATPGNPDGLCAECRKRVKVKPRETTSRRARRYMDGG